MLGSPRSDPGEALKKIPLHTPFALVVIAAFVLVMAQLGAMHHAYSHVPLAAATAQDSNPAIHTVCDDCLSFAPVLSAAGSPTVLAFIAPPARALALRAIVASLISNRLDLAFRSRAPPVSA
jgi:hypothetical protein